MKKKTKKGKGNREQDGWIAALEAEASSHRAANLLPRLSEHRCRLCTLRFGLFSTRITHVFLYFFYFFYFRLSAGLKPLPAQQGLRFLLMKMSSRYVALWCFLQALARVSPLTSSPTYASFTISDPGEFLENMVGVRIDSTQPSFALLAPMEMEAKAKEGEGGERAAARSGLKVKFEGNAGRRSGSSIHRRLIENLPDAAFDGSKKEALFQQVEQKRSFEAALEDLTGFQVLCAYVDPVVTLGSSAKVVGGGV